MFEWDEEEQRLQAMHHPFTAPNPEDMAGSNGASLKTARALAYDLVYNGVEIAGMRPTCFVKERDESADIQYVTSSTGCSKSILHRPWEP